jgi:hypothetical protein
MMYDLPNVSDYGKATETTERMTRRKIAERDAAMTVIEVSRQGPNFPTDIYIMFKLIHGNAEADAHRYAHYLRNYGGFYYSKQSRQWMNEQDEMKVGNVSLTQVWGKWFDIVAARKAYDDIADVTLTDRWGCDPIKIVSRKKIDARLAVERAEGLYDLVLRAFEGRPRRTHEQTLMLRVVKPKRKLPPKRIMSTPTKYVRENGIKIPRSLNP